MSGMSFSLDNHTLATRGLDNTVKRECFLRLFNDVAGRN